MKNILSIAILFSAIAISLIIISGNITLAQQQDGTSNLQFPIVQLGNCTDKASCKTYCDAPEHQETCFEFAQEHNLMTQQEIKAARVVLTQKGPGGCTSKETCETYCDNTDHINECVAFAEQNGLMSPDELAQAKKVQNAIAKGIKPPACGGKDKCDKYCSQPEHMEECINFAAQAGLMSDEEKANSQKVLNAIKNGVKPPPCKGKEECDAYCSQESHFEECLAFSQAAGFMSPQEADMARKTGGKGPGGCQGKEECDAYCQANQDACFQFGVDHGLISQEDLQKMKEGSQKMQEMFNQAPQELLDCLTSKLGADKIQAIKNGGLFSQQDGELIKTCNEEFAQNHPEAFNGENGSPGMNGQGTSTNRMTFGDFINKIPPEIRGCVASNLDPNIFNENKDAREIIDQVMNRCSSQLRPNGQGTGTQPYPNRPMMPFQNHNPEMMQPQNNFQPGDERPPFQQNPLPLNQGQQLLPLNPPQDSSSGQDDNSLNQAPPLQPTQQLLPEPVQTSSSTSLKNPGSLMSFVLETIKYLFGIK